MSTKTVSVTNLVGSQSIATIRAIDISLTLDGGRPSSKMNVFFDRLKVNYLCTPANGNLGDDLITDEFGTLSAILSLPGGEFTTGSKEILITDATTIEEATIPGSTYGLTTAVFRSNGTQEYFQTTTTTTKTFTVQNVYQTTQVGTIAGSTLVSSDVIGDPLAQSFFTYGLKNGTFVTSIDLYFYKKDESIPVRLDIRKLVNGTPDRFNPENKDNVVYVYPNSINTSTDASVATNFKFNKPIYLAPDADFCFVIYSNSKNYEVFTAKMGEKAFENDKTIFEQPYIGSLFKSENDVTWTPEQFEDIKFKINVAKFDISASSEIVFSATPSYIGVKGENFSTTASSNTIRVSLNHKHGLDTSSKIDVVATKDAIYNGIAAVDIAGIFDVTNVIDEYTIEYTILSSATSTGKILTGGQIEKIEIENGGSNYATAPTVSFSGGGSPSAQATGVARIQDGKVIAIDILTPGVGYTSNPTVQFNNTGTGGSQAQANAYIDAIFTVKTNKPVNFVIPSVNHRKYSGTDVSAEIRPTQLKFPGSSLNSYTLDDVIDLNLNSRTYFPKNSMIASPANEQARLAPNTNSLEVKYRLSSTDELVSPIIDIRKSVKLAAYANRINNQNSEVITDPSNSELSATGGEALSKYITKKFSLETLSSGINLFSLIYSEIGCSVDWYIRTSNSSAGVVHDNLDWQLLTCDIERNRSTRNQQYLDYTFYLYDLPEFDTYDLKCVLRSNDPAKTPFVKNFRAIIVA
jgi:hypothetical protein